MAVDMQFLQLSAHLVHLFPISRKNPSIQDGHGIVNDAHGLTNIFLVYKDDDVESVNFVPTLRPDLSLSGHDSLSLEPGLYLSYLSEILIVDDSENPNESDIRYQYIELHVVDWYAWLLSEWPYAALIVLTKSTAPTMYVEPAFFIPATIAIYFPYVVNMDEMLE